jgi:hypothetical protein
MGQKHKVSKVNTTLRKQITREFPELAAGYHLPIMAEVLAIADAPALGGINDSYRPRLAANVVLLDSNYKNTGILIDAVPMAIMGGGNERGFFAMPQKGTVVELAWLNGSPERPFVRSVLGDRQALPWIDQHTMAWQQDESTKQTVDGSGNWKRETPATITDASHTHQTNTHNKNENIGEETKRIKQNSIEDIDGIKQIAAGAIHFMAMAVINVLSLGSINMVAGAHITRSAGKTITDNATKQIKQTAPKVYLGSATVDLVAKVEALAAQVSALDDLIKSHTHGNGNLGSPTAAPIAWVGVKTAVDTIKTDVGTIKVPAE